MACTAEMTFCKYTAMLSVNIWFELSRDLTEVKEGAMRSLAKDSRGEKTACGEALEESAWCVVGTAKPSGQEQE